MRQLIAVIHKELLLLVRDRAGLLVLFVMPAVLVVVITLVQENALKSIGEGQTRILLIDGDGQALGRQIADTLKDTQGVMVTEALDGRTPDRRQALELVAKGAYQLCLIIPPGLTGTVKDRARQSALESLSVEDAGGDMAPAPVVDIYFDPTVLGGFRSAVRHLLDLMIFRLEVSEKMAALARILPDHINRSIAGALEPVADIIVQPPQVDLQLKWSGLPLVRAEEARGAGGPDDGTPHVGAAERAGMVPVRHLFHRSAHGRRLHPGTHQRDPPAPPGHARELPDPGVR